MAEPITLQPVSGVHITTLVDNTYDALLPSDDLVRRRGIGSVPPLPSAPSDVALSGSTLDSLRAEHGFSALVELHTDTGTRRVLFDAGVSPDGLIGNLDRLDLYPDTFEAVVFSHGHFDHVMGLQGVIRRLGRTAMPVVLHPDFWLRRRIGTLEIPAPSRTAIEGAGFQIIEDRQPSFLLDGMLLVTGEVARTTPFEKGMSGHQALRDGEWVPDELIHDDQAVVLDVAGKGLVVLTGCGHAGIVNIVRHAKRLTGVDQVYAILGGLHLRDGPVVPRTVAALAAESPGVVVPAHCTSWMAQHALAAGLPGAFHANAVGSRFEL
ncbi:MAG TPA: MBL fold metallo-hydrolase [Amycolatopsis sp.]|nr:MBL fold metallo-hydrolase [Amycolatopsis sp.]